MAEKLISNINVKVNYLDNISASIYENLENMDAQITENTTNIATNTANIKTNTTNIATHTTNIVTHTTQIADLYNKIDGEGTSTTNECNRLTRSFINSYENYYTATLSFAKDTLKLASISSSATALSTSITSIYTIGDAFMLYNGTNHFVSVPGANSDYSKLYMLDFVNESTTYNLGKNILAYNDKANNAIDIIFINYFSNNYKGFFIVRIDTKKDDTIYYIYKEYNDSNVFRYDDGIFYEIKGKLTTTIENNIENILLYSNTSNNKKQLILTPFLSTGNSGITDTQFVDLHAVINDSSYYATKMYPLYKGSMFSDGTNWYFNRATNYNTLNTPTQISNTNITNNINNYYWFTNIDGSIMHVFVEPPTSSTTSATLYYMNNSGTADTLITIPMLAYVSSASSTFSVCSDEWQFNNNLMITNNGNVQQWLKLTYMINGDSTSVAHYCNSYKGDHFYVLLASSTTTKCYIGVIYPFNYVFSAI